MTFRMVLKLKAKQTRKNKLCCCCWWWWKFLFCCCCCCCLIVSDAIWWWYGASVNWWNWWNLNECLNEWRATSLKFIFWFNFVAFVFIGILLQWKSGEKKKQKRIVLLPFEMELCVMIAPQGKKVNGKCVIQTWKLDLTTSMINYFNSRTAKLEFGV